MMNNPVFKEEFKVEALDPDCIKYDKVSRIQAQSCESTDMVMQLDVNTEIYPIQVGETYVVALATTLNDDGTPVTSYNTQVGRKSLADDYEYIMHGKLYKISDKEKAPNKVEVYISFGGLLMLLSGGDLNTFESFQLDQMLFLLMKKK